MIEVSLAVQSAETFDPIRERAEVDRRIERALGCVAMEAIRSLLSPLGATIEPTSILHKQLTQRFLRIMFPVTGTVIQDGTVVSIVCLYDCIDEKTLYAHPMHAGPNVNPLLKHPNGPMAAPKSQPGQDGDRATVRLLAQKEALWRRFLRERDVLGVAEASSRWREGYYWALKRLYFCTRCATCRWGTPFFDGPDPDAPSGMTTFPASCDAPALEDEVRDAVEAVVASEIWKTEKAYALRGGWDVLEHPRLVRNLEGGKLQMIFPTDAALIEGGSLVAVSVVFSIDRREPIFAHCLSAGPEPEIQFLLGDAALGLPRPCKDASQARQRYAAWRSDAWSQFWLDELEQGIAYASERWLRELWIALDDLFGGDEGSRLAGAGGTGRDALPDEAPRRNGSAQSTSRSIRVGQASRGLLVTGVSNIKPQPAIPFETLQNTGKTCFSGHAAGGGESPELKGIELATLMVNLGRRCNQSCSHCHVDAGPNRTEEMSRETVDMIIDVLRRHRIDTLDITGGAPEMNPHFRHLASTASGLCMRVIDRCNLTILLEPGYEDLAGFLAGHSIEITASMPHYSMEHVDRQRGRGVFDKSIAALRLLADLGYGKPGTGRVLNLVYNPVAAELAPSQAELERRFKEELRDQFGVVFNRLFAMNNMPVNRYRDHLVRRAMLEPYMAKLVGAFHSRTVDGLMCRHSLSVGWDGRLYDCDFNQAAGLSLSDGLPDHIGRFDAVVLRKRTINTAAHCFGCTAGYGSSCSGALVDVNNTGGARRNGRAHDAGHAINVTIGQR